MHAYSISYYSFWTKIANQCVLSLYLGCSLCAVKNKGEVLLRLEIKTFSYFPLFLYFPIYIFNRTSSLWGGISPKWRGKLESEIGGPQPKNWGEVAPNFDSRFGGIEATEYLSQLSRFSLVVLLKVILLYYYHIVGLLHICSVVIVVSIFKLMYCNGCLLVVRMHHKEIKGVMLTHGTCDAGNMIEYITSVCSWLKHHFTEL